MIYAKAFRRGDGFYPQNAIFQDFVLLCVIWQGIDWVRAKKYGKGIAAIAAVVGWPFLFVAVLGMFPQLMQRPIISAVLAFVITSPVPMWTSITDGGWSYLVGGVLLYLLRNHRKAQVAVWALYSFCGILCWCTCSCAVSRGLNFPRCLPPITNGLAWPPRC